MPTPAQQALIDAAMRALKGIRVSKRVRCAASESNAVLMARPLRPAMLLLLCACGAGDDATDGRVLGELSGDEVRALCASIEGELAKTLALQARCTLEAAGSADSAAECEIERDECIRA